MEYLVCHAISYFPQVAELDIYQEYQAFYECMGVCVYARLFMQCILCMCGYNTHSELDLIAGIIVQIQQTGIVFHKVYHGYYIP